MAPTSTTTPILHRHATRDPTNKSPLGPHLRRADTEVRALHLDTYPPRHRAGVGACPYSTVPATRCPVAGLRVTRDYGRDMSPPYRYHHTTAPTGGHGSPPLRYEPPPLHRARATCPYLGSHHPPPPGRSRTTPTSETRIPGTPYSIPDLPRNPRSTDEQRRTRTGRPATTPTPR